MFITSISYFSYITSPTLINTSQLLGRKASGTKIKLIGEILELYVCKHLLLFRSSLDSSSSQQSNLADAVPLPEPPQESRPGHRALSVYEDSGDMVISPQKAGSLGSNRSHDPTSIRHPGLATNTSPRKNKGKGKATETADTEQLKGSPGEFPGSHTNMPPQAASSAEKRKKFKLPPRRTKQTIKPPRGGESNLPQTPEPNQNNDGQERFQGMIAHSLRVFSADDLCLVFSSTARPCS